MHKTYELDLKAYSPLGLAKKERERERERDLHKNSPDRRDGKLASTQCRFVESCAFVVFVVVVVVLCR